jgi:hypothetical protein
VSDDPKPDETITQGAAETSPVTYAGRRPNGQFQKGTSGNLNGRPKKQERAWSQRQREFDTVKEANRLIRVIENGKVEYISTEQALMRQLLRKGINGDMKAAKMALDRVDRSQSSRESRDREVFKDLEFLEKNHEQSCAIGGRAKGEALLATARKKTQER